MANQLETATLAFKILRLTEQAISLLGAGHLDEALSVVDNRERAINMIMGRKDIQIKDLATLEQVDKLNRDLLILLEEAKQAIGKEISTTHKNAQAHKSYHSTQVK